VHNSATSADLYTVHSQPRYGFGLNKKHPKDDANLILRTDLEGCNTLTKQEKSSFSISSYIVFLSKLVENHSGIKILQTNENLPTLVIEMIE
jgi:hypothetical protein